MVLTLGVYFSSFLVLTIEKDWWGGYLTNNDQNNKMVANFQDYLMNGKQLYRENPIYVFENTVRLIFIGCSISFILNVVLIDVIQIIFTYYSLLIHCISTFSSRFLPESDIAGKVLTTKEVFK